MHHQNRRDRSVDRRQVLRRSADRRRGRRRGLRPLSQRKLDGGYPVNPHLQLLLDDIINDSDWDMTYLGMQIMVEGLALAAFGFMHDLTEEPLLKKMLRRHERRPARPSAF